MECKRVLSTVEQLDVRMTVHYGAGNKDRFDDSRLLRSLHASLEDQPDSAKLQQRVLAGVKAQLMRAQDDLSSDAIRVAVCIELKKAHPQLEERYKVLRSLHSPRTDNQQGEQLELDFGQGRLP